ncbi:MAG: PAS domain S-box protein [Myxococcaceae bacterium]|nr:MAG: PAS domain S-box protein [Myxococcaceae bacterium]
MYVGDGPGAPAAAALTAAGLEVRFAADAAEAERLARSLHPAVVVLGPGLADDAADALAAALAGAPEAAHVPVQRASASDGVGPGALAAVVAALARAHAAEDALRDERAASRSLVDAAMDAIVSIDEAQRVVLFNRAAEEMFGCRAAEVLGAPIDRFIPEVQRPGHGTLIEAFGRGREAGRPMGGRGPLTALRADGTSFPVEVSISSAAADGRRVYTAVVRDLTERWQADEARRASEGRYRLLFETMVHGAVHHDRDGRIIELNPAAERILGRTRDELLGPVSAAMVQGTLREDGSLFPGDEHPTSVALRTGRTVRGVLMQVFNPRAGEYRLISIDAVPLCAPGDPLPYEAYATFEDVTERHRALTELRASEARLRLAMRTASMFAFDWDVASDRVLRSPDCGPILGLDGVEATHDTGANFVQRVHPADRPRLGESIAALTPSQPDYALLYRFRRGDEAVLLEERAHGFFDAQGRLARLTGMTADTSERERSVQALRESEQRFRDLANAMPQLVWTATAEGAIDYQNSRAREFRPAAATADHWSWPDVVHPDDLAGTARAWAEALARGAPFQVEHRMQMADGSYRWHLSRASLARYPGAVTRWFGTATDIHDRKVAEESLREADRRKDDFLAVLGHELRNPLTPIRYAVQMMKLAGPDAAALARSRDIIDRQVTHMTRLIDDLLDVSRISRAKVSLRREVLDLAALVAATVADMAPAAEKARQRVEVDLPAAPVLVFGDEARLRQIVINLVQNAINFSPAGSTVAVGLRTDGAVAEVAVRDDGVGIEPESFGMIFVPFSQGGHATAQGAGGLGLGLALVRGLAELHDGGVRVESPGLGLGATFTVWLPVAPAPAPAAPAPAPAPRGGTHRILIIEDNPDIAETLYAVLTLRGHSVTVASTATEGLRQARALSPRVVICDVGLPDLSGYEVARAIRADEGLAATRLIAVTGFGQEDDRRRAREAGFDHHLTKPPDLAALEALLPE